MLFNFRQLIEKHKMDFTGVVHVGAHECGEILNYTENNIQNGILIEANPNRVENLRGSVKGGYYAAACYPHVDYQKLTPEQAALSKNYHVYHYAVTDKDNEKITLNIANFDGGVDSIFKINQFGKDSSWTQYSHVGEATVPTITLDTLLKQHEEEYNFLNIDVEGAELLVLKGAKDILANRIKYIMVETQDKYRFDGSCLSSEIKEFLEGFGFKLVDYFDTSKCWGDAMYIKDC